MATGTFKPFTQTTINAVITAGKGLTISESKMAFRDNIDDEIIVRTDNVLTRYHKVVEPYLTTKTFTDDEFVRYKCQPGLLCYDLYGTPELASSLLFFNKMVSVTEFTKTTVVVFKQNILDVVNELLSLNEKELTANKLAVGE